MKVRGAEAGSNTILARMSKSDSAEMGQALAPRSILARLRRRLITDNAGGTLVEMAVALPVLMLIMTGIFSYSIALYQKLQLAEAISAGGRVLSVDRGDHDPCKTTTAAIDAAGPGLSTGSITLTYKLNGTSQGSGTTSCPGTGTTANAYMVAGGTAEIDASYPCSLTVYGSSIKSCTLQNNLIEVVQ
jgi:Flp pilus assembly protein TadG